ncbi:MAG: hypothetical protein KGL03_00615 [Nitrospirota bacterium]|nr:hypothetical protein [Nitrospirota bacterium]
MNHVRPIASPTTVRATAIAGLVLLSVLLDAPGVLAQERRPAIVSATATLTVLKGSVRHVPAGSTQAHPATDGMNLTAGDRVLTGLRAEALITFLDGSTLEVMPESDVAVKQAEPSKQGSAIVVRINVGMVWARVVRLVDPKSSFSLESNTATATVHDGLIGAHQFEDGSFVCWTKAGRLTVTDRHDRMLTLLPGEKTVLKGDQPPAPQPFAVHQSVLRVTATANVTPLILMDDEVRVAGFVAPGVEVNQVFGSFTGVGEGAVRIVEVPAGAPGPFMLVLEGLADGPFSLTLNGAFKGQMIYQQQLSGKITKGQRLLAQISQVLDPATLGDPKTAKIQSGKITELQHLTGPLPGKILLSADELASVGGSR